MSREFATLENALSTHSTVKNQLQPSTKKQRREESLKEKIRHLISHNFQKPSFSSPLPLNVFNSFQGTAYEPDTRPLPRVSKLIFLSENPVEVKKISKLSKSRLENMEVYAVDGSARSVNRVELSLILGRGVGYGWTFKDIDPTVETFEEVEILTFSHDILSRPDSKVKIVQNVERKQAVTSRVSSLRIEMELKAFKKGVDQAPDLLLVDGPLYHPNFGDTAFNLVQKAEKQGTTVIGLSKTSYARNFINMTNGTIDNISDSEVKWLQRYSDDIAFFETKVETGERGAIWRCVYPQLPPSLEPIVGYVRLGETLYKFEIPYKHKEKIDTYLLPLLRRLSTLRIENDDPYPLDEAHNEACIDDSRHTVYKTQLDSLFENKYRYKLHKLRRSLTP